MEHLKQESKPVSLFNSQPETSCGSNSDDGGTRPDTLFPSHSTTG